MGRELTSMAVAVFLSMVRLLPELINTLLKKLKLLWPLLTSKKFAVTETASDLAPCALHLLQGFLGYMLISRFLATSGPFLL